MNHTYTPPKLMLVDSVLTVEQRYELITSMLRENNCIVDFVKVNGDVRSMPCTLREDLMPVSTVVIADEIFDTVKPMNVETITVWCTDQNAWRAMKTMKVTGVHIAPVSWTVTAEEDPDTGEIILPLPDELLTLQGWNEGDDMNFTANGDGSFTIKKIQ